MIFLTVAYCQNRTSIFFNVVEVSNFDNVHLPPKTLQFIPKFDRAAGVRDANRAADEVSNCKNFKNLVARNAQFVALAEMILDAIIAAQHHRSDQTKHFFGLHIERTFLVSLVVEAPKSFDDFVVVSEDALVHPGAVVVEFFYLTHFLT